MLIRFFDVDKAGELTVEVRGVESGTSLIFTQDFTVNDDGEVLEFLSIMKSGNKFTVNETN